MIDRNPSEHNPMRIGPAENFGAKRTPNDPSARSRNPHDQSGTLDAKAARR